MRPIAEHELAARRRAVARRLAAHGVAGAVLTDPANVRYLGGFALEQPWVSRTRPTACVLAADGTLTVVSSSAVTLDDPPVDAVVRYGAPDAFPAAVHDALCRASLGGEVLGTELGREMRLGMSVVELRAIEALHGAPFVDAADAIWAERMVKSAAELDRLRAAIATNDHVFARLWAGELRPGETERALTVRIRRMMLEEGADEPGWVMMAAGRGSYDRLLSSPRDHLIERSDLVWIDMACIVDGYWSDHSRSGVAGGAPSEEQERMQAVVVEATRRGIATACPGATLDDVARAATIVGEETAGRVGHGLGLASSEPPDVVVGSTVTLVPGMVFTVEPIAIRDHGIYQAEAVVVVTADGCEVLTRAPEHVAAV